MERKRDDNRLSDCHRDEEVGQLRGHSNPDQGVRQVPPFARRIVYLALNSAPATETTITLSENLLMWTFRQTGSSWRRPALRSQSSSAPSGYGPPWTDISLW